ncbi:MAG: histone deacetylase [Planctomycetes bacterium]|nr:histone deacetylase [Planctomycetota bacterium]
MRAVCPAIASEQLVRERGPHLSRRLRLRPPQRPPLCLIALAMATLTAGCALPESFKKVQQPRNGTALNEHVCLVYSQRYQINLGGAERLHSFDINKYAKIYLQLVTDGLIRPEDVYVPTEIGREDLLRVHTPEYLARLRQPSALARYLESGWAALMLPGLADAAILRPFRYATGGTVLAARLAVRYGVAVNLGGGYHHAEPDRGGGFCIYADMPIAIRVLQSEGLIRRALVVDLDVHQGNGTARCVAGDDDVFSFDMHEEDIYPFPKETNDLDIPLTAGMEDDEYLRVLSDHLPKVFDRARPDIVFLQAGVDVLAGDRLARLRLTPEGIIERDRLVFDEAVRRKVPIVMLLGGGYSPQAWQIQYRSIRRVITQYGSDGLPRASSRPATFGEQIYAR